MNAISPELLNSIFSGLVLLVGALATYTASRSRRVGEDHRQLRKRFRTLERRFIAGLQHIGLLEELLAARPPRTVPARPSILEADDGDDDDPVPPAPQPPPAPAAGGGHAG